MGGEPTRFLSRGVVVSDSLCINTPGRSTVAGVPGGRRRGSGGGRRSKGQPAVAWGLVRRQRQVQEREVGGVDGGGCHGNKRQA